jgi:hypothetical protein
LPTIYTRLTERRRSGGILGPSSAVPIAPSRIRLLLPLALAAALLAGAVVHPAPASAARHWKLVVHSRFNRHSLPRVWRAYNGYSKAPGGSYWLRRHCFVRHGHLNLVEKHERSGPGRGRYFGSNGAGWYSCAVRAGSHRRHAPSDSIDHRLSFRARVVRSHVRGVISHRNLPLWSPRGSSAPAAGEEDWMENDGSLSARAGTWHSHFHYARTNKQYKVAYPGLRVTRWHTYVQERRSHRIRVWIDGRRIYSRKLSSRQLPDTVKQPVFQQENPIDGPPHGTRGREVIQIDWVKIKVLRRR